MYHAQLMHNVSDMFIISHNDIVIQVSLWPRVPVQMFCTYFLNFEISFGINIIEQWMHGIVHMKERESLAWVDLIRCIYVPIPVITHIMLEKPHLSD